ncbi:SGNH/GDSL hydrolase family protein [Nocardioides sp. AX2bis]|uniref:SGNH/GDSL hydrolase family protein n=1 Tax=Nocardioides sp. AX2bis TaxID=2653157 RepID=UPI0012F2459C|nr:SGNH/GDSL hydrolase family protein [Nocardioides sp. AX2bis]VXC09876.1 GDSL-like Lipase/Acylhydrolase family protein [Nocardioides sp. AX2bis]
MARRRTAVLRPTILRRGALAGLGALALAAGLLAPAGDPPPAAAAAPSYVALGDSYSSGTGTRLYVDDGTECLRSTSAFPSLLAAQRGYALDFRACSGATIPDVTTAQLGALSSTTSFVTVSVGGNDAGFADVLTTCALPWWAASCDKAVDGAQSFINGTLPGRLSTLYGAIGSRAANAQVVVVGYPRIFGGEDCNAATFFSGAEMTRLNATADLINRRLREAAAARGFAFADPTSRFVGHAVCADAEWLNGLSNPIVESYHPNRAGHASGYLPTVAGQVPAARAADTGLVRVPARDIAASQEQYAALDRDIEPQVVRAPDLTSPAVRRAAERAGIDLDRWVARHAA